MFDEKSYNYGYLKAVQAFDDFIKTMNDMDNTVFRIYVTKFATTMLKHAEDDCDDARAQRRDGDHRQEQ